MDTPDLDSAAGARAPGRKKTGRRPGGADTRSAVLGAARAEFAAHGYEKTSMRGIARAAGVDPALIHHYFGTKQQLLLVVLELPVDPRVIVEQVLAGDLATVGERLLRFALTLWQNPGVRDRMVATVRTALTNEQITALMWGMLRREVVPVIAARLPVPDPELRAELVFSQMVGLAMARHVIGVEPLASADVEKLVALVGPTVQRYLTGD
ncbi:MAG TPA: TetR family transcriptional regulator [Actinocrinis sp.]